MTPAISRLTTAASHTVWSCVCDRIEEKLYVRVWNRIHDREFPVQRSLRSPYRLAWDVIRHRVLTVM